jgi:hypothetical protein
MIIQPKAEFFMFGADAPTVFGFAPTFKIGRQLIAAFNRATADL